MLKEGDILQSWGFVRGRSLPSVLDGKGIRINDLSVQNVAVEDFFDLFLVQIAVFHRG